MMPQDLGGFGGVWMLSGAAPPRQVWLTFMMWPRRRSQ